MPNVISEVLYIYGYFSWKFTPIIMVIISLEKLMNNINSAKLSKHSHWPHFKSYTTVANNCSMHTLASFSWTCSTEQKGCNYRSNYLLLFSSLQFQVLFSVWEWVLLLLLLQYAFEIHDFILANSKNLNQQNTPNCYMNQNKIYTCKNSLL